MVKDAVSVDMSYCLQITEKNNQSLLMNVKKYIIIDMIILKLNIKTGKQRFASSVQNMVSFGKCQWLIGTVKVVRNVQMRVKWENLDLEMKSLLKNLVKFTVINMTIQRSNMLLQDTHTR